MDELTKNRIRVVLVDDEALVRAGLRLIIEGDQTIDIVGEAADGIDASAVVARTQPDVVLMDIRMPRRDGLETTSRVLASHPGIRVIVLTTFDADDAVLTALRNGASGFLLKDTPPADLIDAIHRVAAGRSILSPSVTEQLIDAVARQPDLSVRSAARARLDALTDRERDVAIHVARGASNTEIATQLFLSVGTVKTHLGRVFDKLQADNRVKVAMVVHDAGLN
ncbi:response regulator [Mycetocola zhadangensis]|uniref:DNA-binding response regulator n=1 Tax=Mycetocola zhadangensis TaxID=1164595 RepID=A0A3L7J292_9MICO|nr:response regulator transcription factor [Mycetocola zhadangensis]RLQ84677.1 DNA-binding response regulator [Mycetocola zhadangensis]